MAIKTVENTFDPDHLDTLLCEIKVLATLDKHIHLVNMLASCSSQVDIGKIWLLLEFCSSGNLKSFLTGKDYRLYECPIYRKPSRTDENYLGTVDFESDAGARHWAMRGVALLCDIK